MLLIDFPAHDHDAARTGDGARIGLLRDRGCRRPVNSEPLLASCRSDKERIGRGLILDRNRHDVRFPRFDRNMAGYLLAEEPAVIAVCVRLAVVRLHRQTGEENEHADSDFAKILERQDATALPPIANGDYEIGPVSHAYKRSSNL